MPSLMGVVKTWDKNFLAGSWEVMCCLSNAIIDGGCENAGQGLSAWELAITCCLSNAINDGGCENAGQGLSGWDLIITCLFK